MKKVILFLILAATTLATNTSKTELKNYHRDDDYASELEKIAKKYKSDDSDFSNYDDFSAPESTPDGTADYTDFGEKVYSRQTSFTRRSYFENLNDYSAYNSVGSCGYVSLIQAMSYYDTFYNDNVIPEVFEAKYTSATTETEVKEHSPGVKRQFYYGSGYSNYYEYCHATESNDLQSKLTIVKNTLNTTDSSDKFSYSIGGWDYQRVLNSFYSNYNASVVVNSYQNKTQSEYINLVKDTINSGNPIIVHIKSYDSAGNQIAYHSVVAYDYDEAGIYANFGWNSGTTHSPLLGSPHNYSKITEAFTLDYSAMGHTHSNNYIINGKGHCGCNISDEILFSVPANWKNVPPTLYWMKDIYDSEETYTLSIKASRNGSALYSYTTSRNQITLSLNAWKTILNKASGKIYVQFKRIASSNVSYYNSVTYVYNEPTSSIDRIVLAPAEYGFEERYYFENEGIKKLDIVQGNYTIGTTRLRCGYIESEYIVLSPRRSNAGRAYLIYSFDTNVYRIDVDLTMWSSSESINKSNAKAKLEYKNSNGSWVTSLDLLNDITLTTDRTNPGHYIIVFPEGVTEFRFSVESDAIGSRNKGRICIGDMDIYLGGE